MYQELPEKRFNNQWYVVCKKFGTERTLRDYIYYLLLCYEDKPLREVKLDNAMYYYMDNYGEQAFYACMDEFINTEHTETSKKSLKRRLNYNEKKNLLEKKTRRTRKWK